MAESKLRTLFLVILCVAFCNLYSMVFTLFYEDLKIC